MRNRITLLRLINATLLSIGAILMGFPFVWMVSNSLMSPRQIYRFPPDWIPSPVLWSNYSNAFANLTTRVFLNSFLFTAGVTVGIIILSLMSAYAFAQLRFPLKDALFMLYVSSLMIPWQITIVPQFIIVSWLGWVNSYQGLIVPYFAQISVATFFFRQFFLKIPKDLYDSARIDGCSIPGTFARIYVPLGVPAITAFSTVTALSAWNQYIWPLVVTQSRDMHTLTVALGVLATTRSTGFTSMGVILAASFLSMIPVLLLYIVAQRYMVEGISTTGLKY